MSKNKCITFNDGNYKIIEETSKILECTQNKAVNKLVQIGYLTLKKSLNQVSMQDDAFFETVRMIIEGVL